MLVDEFQDTNPLQNEILELLERDNLFRVGDERQSIYRFRHADVKVFREHHEKAAQEGRAEAIGVNFRSRGEVLDAIDLTFSELWGEEFDPLIEAPGTRDAAAAGGSVRGAAGDRQGARSAGTRPSTPRRTRSARACAASRRGAPPRRGCWPSGSTS